MPEDRELARESTGSPSAHPAPVLSVSALARSVRDLLEHRYPPLWISGEISNFTLARSGHAYFVLKDATAQVRCVMFRNRGQYLAWKPRDGLHVEVHALVSFYEARGEFQLTVETMRQAGLGALYEQFIRLRDRLEKEGLFAPETKRTLPQWPRTIGIVTSLQAAALRDILTTLARRNPGIAIVIYPVRVQGEGSAPEIAAALAMAGARAECDVLILARGGGSIEDLWAFNEEVVARAIRACPIPVISGVGHETDFTIADFASDCRAPTPTAAAEMASRERGAVGRALVALVHRLRQRMNREIETRMQGLDGLARRLEHPGRRIESRRETVAMLHERMNAALEHRVRNGYWSLGTLLHRSRAVLPRTEQMLSASVALNTRLLTATKSHWSILHRRLENLLANLDHLNPQRILERGYSVVRSADGSIVTNAAQTMNGDALTLTFSRGSAAVRVESTSPEKAVD